MSRRQLPKPTQRKGSHTWEIRTRIGGKIMTKSLGTRDYDIALRRLPNVYEALLREQEAKPGAVPLIVGQANIQPAPEVVTVIKRLTVAEACASYRTYLVDCERQFRVENAQAHFEPVNLAADYATRLKRVLREAEAKAIVYDFEHQEWWLTYLANKGLGDVEDRPGALLALARTRVGAYREILDSDRLLDIIAVESPKASLLLPPTSTVPPLSAVLEAYLGERGAALTGQVVAAHRAVVTDLIAVVGDKRIDTIGRDDVRAFKEVVLNLPPNWMKRRELRQLTLTDAAKTAKDLGLPRQAAKTIQMKQALLRMIFDYAVENYDGITNPFSGSAWASGQTSASGQRDAFSKAELKTLTASDLRGHLYWLTWLAICTGARLNELCQLATKHIRQSPTPHIYFGPELRLKTGKQRGNSSVRSVPLHPKLIELGFIDYASKCEASKDGLLFPDLPLRKTGRLSDAPSKAFRRHLTGLGMKRPTLSFHSLRHAFSAEFKRMAPTDVETRERLMGHAVAGVAGRYGNSYEAEANDLVLLAMRARTMSRLVFDF